MQPPTLTQIKLWSNVEFDQLDPAIEDDRLQVLIDRAVDYISTTIGRTIDETIPLPFVTLVQDVIQMRVEQRAYQQQQEYTETGADDQVSSFSVTGYSENRYDGGTRTSPGRGGKPGFPLINAWPALNSLLWRLMTDEARDYWIELLNSANGEHAPGFDVTEVAWSDFDRFAPGDGFVWGA